MLRTALKPKWLALLAVVVLVAIGFVRLGEWQLGVARDKAAKEAMAEAAAAPAVPIAEVLPPHTPFKNTLSLRAVTVTGSYAAQRQFLVPDRRLGGVAGYWVMTGFTDAATNATLVVLRGFTTSPDGIPAPPQGEVTIAGALAPSESPADAVGLPKGQLGSVDLSILVNQWPGEFYNAFLFLTQERTSAGELPAPTGAMTRVPLPTKELGLNWRNASYALQWWVFAGFAFWMWWRMVREDRRRARESESADPEQMAHNGPRDDDP